jgi:signal transduction histidine kinase
MSLQRWRDFVDGVTPGQPLRDIILESWDRCIEAGISSSTENFTVPRVSDYDLQQRIQGNATLLQIAKPHLEWLSAFLSDIPHVVYIVDSDGIVLHSRGVQIDLEANFLSPGYDWSEKSAGTNGAGTAIGSNRPVAIIGSEHIVKSFHRFTCTGAPIHDASGRVVGAIDVSTSAEDGSPERLAAVAHAAFVIERELGQSRAIAVAQEAVSARDKLLAELSHEVRTPLSVITGWAHFLRDEPTSMEEGLDAIELSAWKLSLMIGDLVEISRLTTGKLRLERRPVDLASTATRLVNQMQPIAVRKGVSLSAAPISAAFVFGDQERIDQAVTNLVANAIKFTEAGGSVNVSVHQDTESACLTVSDTGCGISQDVLPNIFEYLNQGDNGERAGGLGIGLSIVRDIVRLHQGEVYAHSDGPQKGASFMIKLPLIEP